MKKNKPAAAVFEPDQLYFLPLGGAEQFGMNFNLYGYQGRWLAVDCGMGFADEHYPGVDILLPDPAFIADRKNQLEALVVTHAHEDHIGAIGRLWPRLRCPIYCSAFTAAVLREKFNEFPECKQAKISVVQPGSSVQLGPFGVEFIHVTHSIPDTCALVIETAAGRVLHSGDWNLDPTPVIGEPTDIGALTRAGDNGILAYIGDSTNAPSPGRSASESQVELGLENVFQECQGRVIVTIFASNVGRLRSIAKAAKVTGRNVAIVGRSLVTMTKAARSCGYMNGVESFMTEREASDYADHETVLVVTGSQGEARAALARMARGEHQNVSLKNGDTVIFSARAIPGNEKEIDAVKNNLTATGIRIIGEKDTQHMIHTSGHPRRDEIIDMLGWVRPQIVIPVHGERVQLEAHAEIARGLNVPHVIVPNNGSVIRLGPGQPQIVDHVKTGMLAVEPNRIVAADHEAISARRRLQFSGSIHVTLVMTDSGELIADPKLTSVGLIDPGIAGEAKMEAEILDEIEDIMDDMNQQDRQDDRLIEDEIGKGVRRFVQQALGMKPNTSVHVIRLED